MPARRRRSALRKARYVEPEPPPAYDPREADVNLLVSQLDTIEERLRRRPTAADARGFLDNLHRYYRPRVEEVVRERWPYARELWAKYRDTEHFVVSILSGIATGERERERDVRRRGRDPQEPEWVVYDAARHDRIVARYHGRQARHDARDDAAKRNHAARSHRYSYAPKYDLEGGMT
jgi:hypothetical protein